MEEERQEEVEQEDGKREKEERKEEQQEDEEVEKDMRPSKRVWRFDSLCKEIEIVRCAKISYSWICFYFCSSSTTFASTIPSRNQGEFELPNALRYC
jgi:hypothetical protein